MVMVVVILHVLKAMHKRIYIPLVLQFLVTYQTFVISCKISVAANSLVEIAEQQRCVSRSLGCTCSLYFLLSQ